MNSPVVEKLDEIRRTLEETKVKPQWKSRILGTATSIKQHADMMKSSAKENDPKAALGHLQDIVRGVADACSDMYGSSARPVDVALDKVLATLDNLAGADSVMGFSAKK